MDSVRTKIVKGEVKGGSYIHSLVEILHDAIITEGGYIRIGTRGTDHASYVDIQKYNVRILSKGSESKGTKQVGETTMLSKDNVKIMPKCKYFETGCSHINCPFSHIRGTTQDSEPTVQEFDPKMLLLSIETHIVRLIDAIPTSNPAHVPIIGTLGVSWERIAVFIRSNDRITSETLSVRVPDSLFTFEQHLRTFVRGAFGSIRVLVEDCCKRAAAGAVASRRLSVQELIGVARASGFLTEEDAGCAYSAVENANAQMHMAEDAFTLGEALHKIDQSLSLTLQLLTATRAVAVR